MDDSEKMAKLLLELRMDAEELGKSLGKTGGDIIRNVLNRRNNLSVKLASAIAKRHNVNYKWLMIGDGEMFLNNKEKEEKESNPTKSNCPDCKTKDFIIEQLKSVVEMQNKTIERLANVNKS